MTISDCQTDQACRRYANGHQVGYRREGDYDVLNQCDEEAQAPGRFFYQTLPLPPAMTRGKTTIDLKIAALGPIWYYGNTFDKYQKPLSQPTRGIYRVYTHVQTRFVPDPSEKQGKRPDAALRSDANEEAIAETKRIVVNRLDRLLKETAPAANQKDRGNQLLLVAEAYNTSWTPAYQDSRAIEAVVRNGDAMAVEFAEMVSGSEFGPDWAGAGPLGEAIMRTVPAINARLDEKVSIADREMTRRELWARALRNSMDYWRRHRRRYTNQSMIVDWYIYTANRGLQLIDPNRALPEAHTLRFLYEAIGIEPWLGNDPLDDASQGSGKPEKIISKPYGENYRVVTRKGNSRELGWVSSYGETILNFTSHMARMTGDEKIRQQLAKLQHARLPFRYPGVDADGYRCMKLVGEIDNRTARYPHSGAAYLSSTIREAWWMHVPAVLSDVPDIVGAAQRSISDGQYFAYIKGRLKDADTLGMLRNVDEYAKVNTLPKSDYQFPMEDGQPDFAFADEEDAVIALKHGDTRLFINMYYRSEYAVNSVARILELTPITTRIATVRTQTTVNPSGKTFKRPDWIDWARAKGMPPPGQDIHQAWAGEEMPIAARPEGATVPAYGEWGPFVGKAESYRLKYGDYLIVMNCSETKDLALDLPPEFANGRDLVSGRPAPALGASLTSLACASTDDPDEFEKTFTFRRFLLLSSIVCIVDFQHSSSQDLLSAMPTISLDRHDGVFACGESVVWTITAANRGPRRFSYVVRKDNVRTIASGTIDLSSGPAKVETRSDEQAMLYLELLPLEPGIGAPADLPIAGSAAISPTMLLPVALRPTDFDAFWNSKIEQLHQVPEDAQLTAGDSGTPGVDYAVLRMGNIRGTHVWGQIAKPAKAGKRPAIAVFQWAGDPYPLEKPWVTDYASKGWLALNISPHDLPPDKPKEFYHTLPKELKAFHLIGQEDLETNYFVRMYLGAYRAVDYLTRHPDWDGKTLVVLGTSMGGMQAMCVSGLHPRVTHVIANEPAGCDLNASLHSRAGGFPPVSADNPQAMRTANYYDVVHFAPRIQASSLVAMGYLDTVCPPTGIWTAFNQIAGPKRAVPMVDSRHNHQATEAQQRPFHLHSTEWLEALARGDAVPLLQASDSARTPRRRTDAASMEAHELLLQKARQGKMDLLFVGDSITRRWGCGDAQYTDKLANWKANFHGWNAGNFGWGGDTTQNILWRIQNGEIDGIHPKAIVILAGTNNIGTQPRTRTEIADIAGGIIAIVDGCRARAPNAAIILTGIFPRNDNIAVMSSINAINRELAHVAIEKGIRYLNVNENMADSDGKLREGMMEDGLHPAVKGYQVWADGLKPILFELLGPPASIDQAPPPTTAPNASR